MCWVWLGDEVKQFLAKMSWKLEAVSVVLFVSVLNTKMSGLRRLLV